MPVMRVHICRSRPHVGPHICVASHASSEERVMTKKQKHFEPKTSNDTADNNRHKTLRSLLATHSSILRHTRAMDGHNKDTAAPDVVPEASTQDSTAVETSTQDNTALEATSSKSSTPHSNRTGWDGKLWLNGEKQAVLANPEALENSDYEDDDAPPVDQIAADEGA
jgi:hypothetical protein